MDIQLWKKALSKEGFTTARQVSSDDAAATVAEQAPVPWYMTLIEFITTFIVMVLAGTLSWQYNTLLDTPLLLKLLFVLSASVMGSSYIVFYILFYYAHVQILSCY